ncbi:MAG: molybdate ABC transporter substrate-binding protein [Rhodanobacter sp.]
MKQSTRRCLALLFVLPMALTGTTALAAELVVSAASSLTNAFRDVARAYEAAHPETHVVLNFASSDTLMRQIVQGAPVDVFASADQAAMDQAQAQGMLAASTRADFAANQLVLVLPASSAAHVDSLKDLLGARFKRVAWGNPASVPAGRYAQRVLERAGLANALQPRAVLAQNVRQCLDYVSRDEVDAGFVYATDAALARDRVRVALRLDSPTPITYPIAIVADTAHASDAESFRQFVLSADGQTVLAKYGFLKPP